MEILTLNKIADCGLDLLDKNVFNISDDAKDPDGIILRSFSMHEMELGDNLKAVARAGAGTNNIPIEKCSEKGNSYLELSEGTNIETEKFNLENTSVFAVSLKKEKDFSGTIAITNNISEEVKLLDIKNDSDLFIDDEWDDIVFVIDG